MGYDSASPLGNFLAGRYIRMVETSFVSADCLRSVSPDLLCHEDWQYWQGSLCAGVDFC